MIKAENGIEIQYNYYQDKEGHEKDKVVQHQVIRLLKEKIALLEAQSELSAEALSRWKDNKKEDIRKNPLDFVSDQQQPGVMKVPETQSMDGLAQKFYKTNGRRIRYYAAGRAGVLGKFYFASICIVIILFLSVGSIRYAIDLLFHDIRRKLYCPYFSLCYLLVFIFSHHTFSKEQRPAKSKLFSLSNIIRVSFIVLLLTWLHSH